VVLLQQKMEALTKQKQELEQLQGQLKTVKSDAEKREQEALRLHSVLSQCFQIDQQAEFSYIFYRAMLCIRSTSHVPVSVRHKSVFYRSS